MFHLRLPDSTLLASLRKIAFVCFYATKLNFIQKDRRKKNVIELLYYNGFY